MVMLLSGYDSKVLAFVFIDVNHPLFLTLLIQCSGMLKFRIIQTFFFPYVLSFIVTTCFFIFLPTQ